MRATKELTAPAYEPVTLARAKEWLLIESDASHDNVINQLIKGMREYAENLTHRVFVERTFRLYMDQWPYEPLYGARICLTRTPARSVQSVKYTDLNGALTTLDPSVWELHDEYEPAFIVPAYLAVWPNMRIRPDALQVDFTAGYEPGSPADGQGWMDAMPGSLLTWMEARMATLFENREQVVVGSIVNNIPRDFSDGLLDSLVVGTRLF